MKKLWETLHSPRDAAKVHWYRSRVGSSGLAVYLVLIAKWLAILHLKQQHRIFGILSHLERTYTVWNKYRKTTEEATR